MSHHPVGVRAGTEVFGALDLVTEPASRTLRGVCHIVEHEDNEMMRPYAIGPIPSPIPDRPVGCRDDRREPVGGDTQRERRGTVVASEDQIAERPRP